MRRAISPITNVTTNVPAIATSARPTAMLNGLSADKPPISRHVAKTISEIVPASL